MCVHVYVCVHVCIHACILCVHVCVCVCVCVCVFVCVSAHIYMCECACVSHDMNSNFHPSGCNDTQKGQSNDLLSMLLSRGTELRQAMVASSLGVQNQEQNNSNVGLHSPASAAVRDAAR